MRIFICGDSTAASYKAELQPLTGWGQVLGDELPGVEVINHAMAGRSTKSFLAEGRLLAVEKALQPGDLLLIQFTHNDYSDLVWRHTDADTSFMTNLGLFVDTARLYGAEPVLLTPIPVRSWQNGVLQESHGCYPDALRRTALQKGVKLIDVYREGTVHLRSIGEEASAAMHMIFGPGCHAGYPNGQTDNVHTCRQGAQVYARIVAQGLRDHHLV